MLNGEKIQGLLVGIGTIVVTILMAQGEWDFFDLIISMIMLLLSIKLLNKINFKSNIIISLFLGLILTTFSLSLISIAANISSNCCLSTVNVDTYRKACFSKEDKYTLFHVSDYTIKKFMLEHEIFNKNTIKELESKKNIDFQKLDFYIHLKDILKNEKKENRTLYFNTLKNSSAIKELHVRNEILWQIFIFLIMFITTYLVIKLRQLLKST